MRGDSNGAEEKEKDVPIAGLGDNFDDEDDTLVFKIGVNVSDLSDKASRSWVATFLLGAPSLGDS